MAMGTPRNRYGYSGIKLTTRLFAILRQRGINGRNFKETDKNKKLAPEVKLLPLRIKKHK
jgi:hypothetical protein